LVHHEPLPLGIDPQYLPERFPSARDISSDLAFSTQESGTQKQRQAPFYANYQLCNIPPI
jgi:hypothetical protein